MRSPSPRRAVWQVIFFTVAASLASAPTSAAAPQAPLTVTGAPASAPQGSGFKVGTSGGSGTGAVTFSVSGGCANTSGSGQVTMTSDTVVCTITATKAADAGYEATTSAPVAVIATGAAGPGSFATLKAFTGPDGIDPAGPMVQMADGWVFGLTVARADGCATAFRFNPSDPAATFATIWASAGAGGPGCHVGDGGLVQAADGNMYFVTTDGGPCNGGRIFRVTPPTTVAPVVDFYGCVNDGRLLNPGNGVTVAADGALYGVATGGGANGTGGLYRVGLDGALSTRASFPAGQTGQRDALTAGSDGRLYGTAANFFSASFLYRVDPASGVVETVQGSLSGFPRGRLLEVPPRVGHTIAFVGVTQNGGAFSAGVVYRVDVAAGGATFSTLHDFNVGVPTYLGETPAAGLIRAPDGTLYGTTAGYAGFLAGSYVGPGTPDSGELGTVFRIGTDGVIAKLYGGPPFIQPFGPVLLGADGYLYGTSYVGDAIAPLGSVFRVILPVGKTVPVITWPTPLDIPYGTPLSATQLNATADVSGTFVYTPPAGTVLNVGPAQVLSVTFTPTDTNLYETAYASVLITITKALQAPLTITGAPASAVYGTSFTVSVSGGSGTGAVSFAVSGACSNTAGGALVTMTSGTGACSIAVTKASDSNYQAITSTVLVTAIKAAQAPLALINAPASALHNTTFTVDASGGTGTGALSFSASGACSNTGGGALITMTSGTGTCTLSATKAGDANYLPATAAAVSVAAIKLTQVPLIVTGAPTNAPQGSSFKVGTSGGSGTGAVTFSVSGGCANTGGIGQVTMTSDTVVCTITATKAADASYDATTSAPVAVIATTAAGPGSFATLKAFTGPDGVDPAGPMVQMPDGWIYGLTVARAGGGGATAFRFNPIDPAGTFATIWASAGGGGPGAYVGDGGLVRAADDNLYFVTTDGGPCNGGRIFRVTPPTTVAPLVDFYGCVNDGRLLNPGNGVTVGADGALYGVATAGGANGTGGLYRVGLDGALSTRASFPAGQTGQRDALTAGSDGRLYGTAANVFSASFVYRVDPASSLVETVQVLPSGFPRGRLLEVSPRVGHTIAFVGVTQNGGAFSAGVVYRVDVAAAGATFSTLHDFNVGVPTYLGETPAAGLIQATDGTLYGTTAGYGFFGGPGTPDSGELGTVFRIGTDGVIAKVYGGPPLIQPFGPLLLGADGYLYGTSYVGDATAPLGSVFRVILPSAASVPSAPTGVTGARGNGQVVVSFTPPANNGGSAITSYTATASPGGATASGSSSPITVTGLANGTAYTFTVAATNGVGTGPASAASPPVTPATVPGAPINVSAIGGNAQAIVTFTAATSNGGDPITSYTVTASTGGATAMSSASPITVTGLTNGTSYTFTVRATNGVGSSAPSTASNAVTPTAVPGTPLNFAVTASGLSILGTWTSAGAAATAHTLQVATSGAFSAVVFSLPLGAASSFSLDAPPGTAGTFFFRVIASNPFGSSAPTPGVGVALPAPITSPGAPVLQNAVVAGTNIALTWTPGSGGAPSSYLLLVGSSSGASNVGMFPMGTFTTVSSSAPNGTYFARVQASNAGGSAISNEISFTVGTPCVAPTAPTSPTVSRSGNTITVSWGAPAIGSGPFSYTIVAGTSAGSSNLGLFPVGSVTTISAPVSSGSYFLRVRAGNACGVSGDSVEVSMVVP